MRTVNPAESPARLLVVDDDESILDLLASSLRFAGFEVESASDGRKALEIASTDPTIDLVVLDVMMPGLDGFEVVKRLRAERRDVPVVFLTARDTSADRVNGLTAGGDDYLAKPFSLDELVARVRAVLRRTRRQAGDDTSVLGLHDLEMDVDSHEVRKAGEVVELSPTEFKLLRYFLLNPGRVLSKQQILDHVWQYDFGGDGNVVETYVSYLRRKLDTGEPRLIHTVRGVGYVLRRPR